MTEEIKSKIILEKAKVGYWLIVKDQNTENRLPLTKEEIILIYAKIKEEFDL